MKMDYDALLEAQALLMEMRPYVQKAHDEAEAKHDAYGDLYGDAAQWEVMQKTSALLARLDALHASFA